MIHTLSSAQRRWLHATPFVPPLQLDPVYFTFKTMQAMFFLWTAVEEVLKLYGCFASPASGAMF